MQQLKLLKRKVAHNDSEEELEEYIDVLEEEVIVEEDTAPVLNIAEVLLNNPFLEIDIHITGDDDQE